MEPMLNIPNKTAHQAVHEAIRNDHGVTEPFKINGVPQPDMRMQDNRVYDKDKAEDMAYASKPNIDYALDIVDSAVSDKIPEGLVTLTITRPDGTVVHGFNKDPENEVVTENGHRYTTKQLLGIVATGNHSAEAAGKRWDVTEDRAKQLEEQAQQIRDNR